ncbi:Fur family transcriptional regulator [Terrabacter terrigena]|uniref:Fur family transcriptional regulator n=1 Tax=Terrabacter terrigena TaxID=574718 RepID=A0ABW3MX35_9MICO
MTNPPESARVEQAVDLLRAAGERLTPARYAVLRVVDAADRSDEHLTAEDIGARVAELEPAVHRATVYRTLTSLVDTGVLSHVHLGGAATVYHLSAVPAQHHADHDTVHQPHGHHAHVQCHACGKVLDVAPEVFDDVAERLRADLGFVLDTGHAALLGTCQDCLT